MEKYEKAIESLRHEFLCDEASDEVSAFPFAEQHALAALAALETAQRHFALARLHQVRAIADRTLGR